MVPRKRRAQPPAKEPAQNSTPKSNPKPGIQSQLSLKTTKTSTPNNEAAVESATSSSSSLRAGRRDKKRPREEVNDYDDDEEETSARSGPSSASVPVSMYMSVPVVGTDNHQTKRITRSSSRTESALGGPLTLGARRPSAADTVAHGSADDCDSTESSASEEDESLSSQSRTHDAGAPSRQAGTSSALEAIEAQLAALRRDLADTKSDLAAAKEERKKVLPYLDLVVRALRSYPSEDAWNNAKANLAEFQTLSSMNLDKLLEEKQVLQRKETALLEKENRLENDKKELDERKKQLEEEIRRAQATGMITSSTTSSVIPSIKAFLTIVTAKQDLPVLSLNAFATQKKTNKVSKLTRVDVPARKRADVEPVLQGFVLPEDLSWPFFGVAKQRLAKDKHVLVHRVQGMNKVRSNKVLSVVKGGGSAAIMGSPGIGKSCSMNFFLMEFVRHLGEPDWKKVVLVRFGSTFLKIFRDEVSGEIQCEEYSVSSLRKMNKMLERYWETSLDEISQMVLLLELDEDEVDPKTGGIPCIVTTSNRDAQTVLKTVEKTGGLHWFLEEPHSEEEAEAVVRLLNAASPSGKKFDWLNVVKPRWEIIPRPREYLSNTTLKGEAADDFFDALKGVSVFNVPAGASNVLAPYYVQEATDPDVIKHLPGNPKRRCYEMRLFSLAAALSVGQKIEKNAHLRAVERLGVRWQIEEAYAAYGGLLKGKEDMLDEQFTRERWEWYKDLGPGKDCLTGKKKPMKFAKPPIILPQCDLLKSFPGQFFDETADQMVEDRLYHSTVHNSPLVDYLYKHGNTIYAVQVSSLPCEKHQFNMETLTSFLDRLGLLTQIDGEEKYKFVFLYIMGENVKKSQGMGVVVKEKIPEGPKKKKQQQTVTRVMSLQEAVEILNSHLNCTSYLIRAGLMPLDK